MGSAKEKDDSKESPNSGNGPPEEQQQLKPKSAEDKQFEENVKFLYRSHQREPGKRRVRKERPAIHSLSRLFRITLVILTY